MNHNFLNIQTPSECLELLYHLDTSDNKTMRKTLAGVGNYFQENYARFKPVQLKEFVALYSPHGNMKLVSPGLEGFVTEEIQQNRAPHFLVDIKNFTEKFKKSHYFHLLDLVAQQNNSFIEHYLKNSTSFIKNALKLNVPALKNKTHFLHAFFNNYPQEIAIYCVYSDAQKLQAYCEYFKKPLSPELDKEVLKSLFKTEKNQDSLFTKEVEEKIWDLAITRISQIKSLENENSKEKELSGILFYIFEHNASFLKYFSEKEPELCRELLNQKTKSSLNFQYRSPDYQDYYQGQQAVTYTLNGAQNLFLKLSKNESEAAQSYLSNFYKNYEQEILNPIEKQIKYRNKTISFMDLVFDIEAFQILKLMDIKSLNKEDLNAVAAMSFDVFYKDIDLRLLEKNEINQVIAKLPKDLILFYKNEQDKNLEETKTELPNTKKIFLKALLEKFLLQDNIAVVEKSEIKNSFKL